MHSSTARAGGTISSMFIHTVYFWLTDDATDDVRGAMLEACRTSMPKIPSARHVWSGGPAMTPRPVVDNTYDIGLCVVLDDVKAHDEYQAHALHQAFLSDFKKYWKRVQIYDFQ
jgi:hypothetical protein